MLKKMTLFVVMGLAAIALAIPAAASAEWLHEGKPLTKEATVTMSGLVSLTGPNMGVDCEAKTDVDLNLDAVATSYKVGKPTEQCWTTGELSTTGCQVESVTATGLPWTGIVVAGNVVWIDTTVDYGLTCLSTPLLKVAGEPTFTPDNAEAIETMFPSGAMESNLGEELEMEGELAVSPSGTYGLK